MRSSMSTFGADGPGEDGDLTELELFLRLLLAKAYVI